MSPGRYPSGTPTWDGKGPFPCKARRIRSIVEKFQKIFSEGQGTEGNEVYTCGTKRWVIDARLRAL